MSSIVACTIFIEYPVLLNMRRPLTIISLALINTTYYPWSSMYFTASIGGFRVCIGALQIVLVDMLAP